MRRLREIAKDQRWSRRCRSITSSRFTEPAALLMTHRRLQLLIANPRDIAGFFKELPQSRFTLHSGVNTLFNALAQSRRASTRSISRSLRHLASAAAWRCRSAARKLWKEDRLPDRRRLRPVRDLARRLRATRSTARSSAAPSACRCPSPKSSCSTTTATRCRRASAGRDLRQGPAGDGRLLAAPRRDREGHDAGRLSSAPATSARSTSAATSRSSTARRT